MTNKRLHQLAFGQALELWAREHEFRQKHSGDEISQTKEARLWKEVEELRELVLEDEAESKNKEG